MSIFLLYFGSNQIELYALQENKSRGIADWTITWNSDMVLVEEGIMRNKDVIAVFFGCSMRGGHGVVRRMTSGVCRHRSKVFWGIPWLLITRPRRE